MPCFIKVRFSWLVDSETRAPLLGGSERSLPYGRWWLLKGRLDRTSL